jgi:hypothetical protein
MLYAVGVGVHGEDLALLTQQVHQVTSVSTAGIEYTHSGRDITAQDLVEDVDINLSKLLLDA